MDSKDEVRGAPRETMRFRMKVTMLVTGEVLVDTDGLNVAVEVTRLRPVIIEPTLFERDSPQLEQMLMPYAMSAVLRSASDEVRRMLRKSNEELTPQFGGEDGAKA